ncbi:monoamine oxidase [Streptomyces sp. 2323.1]|uniref:flavin monoamine oxidase family protein n=1 Tax=Streptomyces sp. 2323.1 TaxID=1938841 RepID=UPI000BB7D23D|nr:FAD-dependent oxidoreductase [Streptomyces sp. 2323.1]SOE15231.1 monoamine oxidase [Streptomyces sp. 2323.1]
MDTSPHTVPAVPPSSNGHRPEPEPPSELHRQLARALLLIGPNDEDLKLRYLKTLIDNGLPPATAAERKRVLIVGAGIAGLVAGHLLKNAGHEVTILEANANRVGGRLKTFRTEDPKKPAFWDEKQYAEAGAMRIPDFHPLALALVDKLGLTRRLFYNVDIEPGTGCENVPVPPVVYHSFKNNEKWHHGNESPAFKAPDKANRTWIRTNRVQVRRRDYARNPRPVNEGFNLSGSEACTQVSQLVHQALEPVRNYYSVLKANGERENKPFEEWLDGWARVIRDFDGYSMGRFLREYAGFSDEAIEAIGTIENMTSRLHLAFFHTFLGRSDINPNVTYWEIDGGSWKLPYRLADGLKDNIQMGQRMTRLEYLDPWSDDATSRVTQSLVHRVEIDTVSEQDPQAPPRTWEGDLAIVTVPFSSLRFVQVNPPFSYKKRRAIIETHYDQATKVLLEFSRRWWEFTEEDWKRELGDDLYQWYQQQGEDEAEAAGAMPEHLRNAPHGPLGLLSGVADTEVSEAQLKHYRNWSLHQAPVREASHVFGGGSTTDNPNRFMYHPSHPVPGSEGGVVLASYSWSDDAARWDSMDDDERYIYALRNLQTLHGRRIEAFYTFHGRTQSWLRDPYAFGEAAVYTPHQMTSFHLDAMLPEGPVHFAGEHISLKHAWIEGAVETAVAAAIAVHETARPADLAAMEPAAAARPQEVLTS